MIIQKTDNKKIIVNITVLVVVLGLAGYFIFSNNSSSDQLLNEIGGSSNEAVIVKKFSSLKKIELEVFSDKRYLDLLEVKSNARPKTSKGNTNPFAIE